MKRGCLPLLGAMYIQYYLIIMLSLEPIEIDCGERTGLVVRASDSGSGDPGSILGQVGVLFPYRARDIYSPKVLVIPRNRWLSLNMTEKLFTVMLNKNKKNEIDCVISETVL